MFVPYIIKFLILVSPKNTRPPDGAVCVASGWGLDEHEEQSTELKYAQLPIVNQKKCKSQMGAQQTLFDTDICAGTQFSSKSYFFQKFSKKFPQTL